MRRLTTVVADLRHAAADLEALAAAVERKDRPAYAAQLRSAATDALAAASRAENAWSIR